VEEAPQKLQQKITSYQNMANMMLTRMNTTITNIKNKKETIKAEVEKKIKEAEEGNYPQEEIDRVKEEVDQQLQAYEDEIEEAEKLLEEQKEKAEKEIEELTGKYKEKIDEAKAMYEDGKGQIEAAVTAIKNLDDKLKEIWENVKEEAKRIVKENVNDFVDEAQNQVMAAVPDVERMKSLSYSLKDALFREVREAVPELRKMVEGRSRAWPRSLRALWTTPRGCLTGWCSW
jgi:chromosome segregation ATPase